MVKGPTSVLGVKNVSDNHLTYKTICGYTVNKDTTNVLIATSVSDGHQSTWHLLIRNNERLFKCTRCKKWFRCSSTLQDHLRIHSGEKPYKYTHCDKCFIRSSDLKSHLLIHTNERPFKCTQCEKCFTRKQTLFYHKRKFHSDSPHKCESCGKDFTDDNALKRHDCEKRSARDKERFTCWMCDEYCYDHCGYLYHMYKHMQG